MEDKKIGTNDRAVEHFLLEELVDRKLEIKSLKEENTNLITSINAFRNILTSIVKKIKIETVENGTEKMISFGTFSSEENKNIYDILIGFAKETGALENE